MLKLYLLVAVIISFSGAAYYVNNLQNRLQTLTETNTRLINADKTNQATITELQDTLVIQQKLTGELSAKLREADEAKTVLLKKLQKHDLAKLAAAKPKLIESRINAATTKVFDELELITSN